VQEKSMRDIIIGAMAAQVMDESKKGKTAPSAPRPRGKASGGGCAAIIVLVLLMGLIGAGLQKIGCIPSDDALRGGTTVSVIGQEVNEEKALFIIRFKVANQTKWPVRVDLDWVIRSTTSNHPVVQRRVSLEKVPARGQTEEQRVVFDLKQLRYYGITDPLDSDVCDVAYSIALVKEAGK
jgi:hypothetical protein